MKESTETDGIIRVGEIDRVLKKINEGSAEFESILAKVNPVKQN